MTRHRQPLGRLRHPRVNLVRRVTGRAGQPQWRRRALCQRHAICPRLSPQPVAQWRCPAPPSSRDTPAAAREELLGAAVVRRFSVARIPVARSMAMRWYCVRLRGLRAGGEAPNGAGTWRSGSMPLGAQICTSPRACPVAQGQRRARCASRMMSCQMGPAPSTPLTPAMGEACRRCPPTTPTSRSDE